MIKLVIVKNPFEPWNGREVHDVEKLVSIGELQKQYAIPGVDMMATLNGAVADPETVPQDGDFVVIFPAVEKGGKSILGLVAMVALAAVSFGAGGLAAGSAGMWGTGAAVAHWGWASYALAATTMFLGSKLVQRCFVQKPNLPKYEENNPTYSWNGVETMEGQNNAIAITYGKVKSGGQSIAKFVEVNEDKETLNWLVSAGEGPLTISNIMLNDNPIDYYTDCTVELREGTNDQEIIANFNDTYFTKQLGYQILDEELVNVVQGDGTEGIKLKIEFPNGLYKAGNNGGLEEAWVKFNAWYRLKNASTWNYIVLNEKITAKTSSALRKEFRVDNLAPGEYEVKVSITERSESVTSSLASVRCYWTEVTSIVYDDFTYPNIALLGIKALATNQISGSPTLTFIKERPYVWVWNPYTSQYEEKPANNPAWASYDMLHQCQKLFNINTEAYEYVVRGASKDVLLYDQFSEWADFCSSKQFFVNIEINQTGELLDVINGQIASCGRGVVIRFGTKYGCVWNCIKQPVQMFGMGNIMQGTFQEEFLQTSDRANAVEVSFVNAAHDYQREVITIYSDTYDTDATEKTAQVSYDGITSYEQAYREGMYQLYANKYQCRTVTFEANIDAIACSIGDVVLVAHDVPKWAYSGRIEKVLGQTIDLPVDIEDLTKDYRIQYRTINDAIYTSDVTIVSSADGWTKVTVKTPFKADDPPQKGDVFDLALTDKGSKPFVIQSITRAQDFTRTITCLEYSEALFNEDYDIPPMDYSSPAGGTSNVVNLTARQTKFMSADGSFQYKLEASWEYDKAGTFIVYGSYDGENYTLLANGTNDRNYSSITYSKVLKFRVVTKLGIQLSTGTVVDVDQIDDVQHPSVTNIRAYNKYRELGDDIVRYDIEVVWDKPISENYKQAQVWYKTSGLQVQNIGTIPKNIPCSEIGFAGNWIFAGIGLESVVIPQAITGDTYKIAVCAQDLYGNAEPPDMAPQKTILVTMKTETPNTPTNAFVGISDTFNVSWEEVRNADVKYYEVRTNSNVGAEAGLLARTSETSIRSNAIVSRWGKVYIYAISASNKISAPAIFDYSFNSPVAPVIAVNERIQGLSLNVDTIPSSVLGVHWFVDGIKIEEIKTNNKTYTYSASAGIYSVSACYYDYFGDGSISAAKNVTISATIPPELIADESIMLEKLSADAQKAIESGGLDTVNIAVKGLLGEGSALVLQPDGSYALVASNGEVLTGMFANNNGVITLQGKYTHITGDTKIDGNVITDNMLAGGISANKINATSLSAISATVGHIRTASSGARIEIGRNTGKPNLFEVIDANGVVRVRLGEW